MTDRFKMLLEQLRLSPSEFADRIGVQRSSVSHVMAGRNKPGIDFLEKILNAFPEIDITWLITGKKGQITNLIKEESNAVADSRPVKEIPGNATENKKTPLPYDEEAVDHIILVYKNNTFRMLNHPEK